ncbi:MAG: DNA repair protein RecO, partial [Minisyncoccia bacterium]
IILTTKPAGEAGKYVYVLTRELGLISAKAQGLRLLNSKLRYSLQDFSLTEVSLVRGKEVWRLTGAKLIKENNLIKKYPDNFLVLFRLSRLLLRLLHGEEKNEKLYDLFYQTQTFLYQSFTPVELKTLEIVAVLRILRCLGYFGEEKTLERFAEDNSWNKEILNNFLSEQARALVLINNALKETQL